MAIRAHVSTILIAAMLFGLVVLLGFLQYRWVGQITHEEGARAHETLQAGLTKLTLTFDREIADAWLALQIGAGSIGSGDFTDYEAGYRRWRNSARAPNIVNAVYAIQWPENGDAVLTMFDSSHGTFVPVPWPANLAHVQSELARRRLRGEHLNAITLVDGESPAVVSPIVSVRVVNVTSAADVAETLRKAVNGRARSRGATVIVFNRAALFHELEALGQEYLPGYAISVRDASTPARVVFASGSDAPRAEAQADATQSVFSLNLKDLPAVHFPGSALGMTPISLATGRPPSATPPLWKLLVGRQGGSLSEAIARARGRNLAISFSVLLVLAAAVALMLLYARRAGAVAAQQLDFIAAVSHELRTPLAVLASAADNLATGTVRAPDRVQEYGTIIGSETRRLRTMVEKVIDFARSAPGAAQYRIESGPVADIVQRAVDASRYLLAESGFEVAADVAPSAGLVYADGPALARAVENLIANAVKYAGDDRTISITASGDVDHARIQVADRGRGIAPDDLPRIFEPFFRARAVVEAQIPGTGLGLAIVQRVVEAHGGTVHAESTEGAGSVFTIELVRRRKR